MASSAPRGSGEAREIRSYAEYEAAYLPHRKERSGGQAGRESRSSLTFQLSPERVQSIQEKYFAYAKQREAE